MIAKYVKKENLSRVVDELTVSPDVPFHLSFSKKTVSFPVYHIDERNKQIYVPKFWNCDNVRFYSIEYQEEKKECVSDSVYEFFGNLRNEQETVVETVSEKLRKNKGLILSLPCGFGKTIIALYIISVLKLKTLIIVNKTFLMNQWEERIKVFLKNPLIIFIVNKTNYNQLPLQYITLMLLKILLKLLKHLKK